MMASAPDATRYRERGCSPSAGSAARTASGPRLSSALSRAGTTPASPPPPRSPSSARRSTPAASRRSIPRSSSTSRPRARRCACATGCTRHIDWPEFEVYEARIPRAPRDLILLSGPEPAIRWRTFCQTVIDLSEALGVQMVTSLGALLADVPHSRPVSVTGIASDESLVERARPQRVALRGSDRDRRRPPGRRRRRRPPRRVAVGGGAALRRGRAEPEGRARAAAQARDAGRRERRRHRAREQPRSTTSARSRARSRWTPTSRRSSSASSAPPTRRTARARTRPDLARRGDLLRARVPARSCASAARTSRSAPQRSFTRSAAGHAIR